MLTDARKVLVDAHKYKKMKSVYHKLSNAPTPKYFWQKVIENEHLKSEQFLHFLKIYENLNEKALFVKIFAYFEKMQKMLRFQNVRSQWLFVKNTSELVRLKAHDKRFSFFIFVSIYEHFTSICEHLYAVPKRKLSKCNFYESSQVNAREW